MAYRLHLASTSLVRSADTIVIEDLSVAGLVRNRSLARAISDCSWGEFRRTQTPLACESNAPGRSPHLGLKVTYWPLPRIE